MDSMEFSCPHEGYKALFLQQTIGDKISWDTLLTEATSKDTFIVFTEK